MLFQIIVQCFTYSLVYGSHNFAVSELRLGLSFKLWFLYLDRDYSRQTFTEVIACDFYFGFFQHLVVFGIFLQRTGQCAAETCKVRTTFDGIDIVYVRVDIFVIRRIVHDSHFHRCALFLCVDVDYIIYQMFAGGVDVADEFLQTFFRVENFHLGVVFFVFYTKVGQSDLDACIQIGQLAHTGSKDLVVVNGFREDRVIRPELLTCTCNIACSDFLYRIQRMSAFIFLLIDFSVAENLRSHVCGQGVHTRYTYTVQTSGYFVRSLIELTAGMQYGHDNFQG